MPRINPLAPASGGTRCANFPANSRVSVQLFAAGRPARADRNMTWSTAALAGGRLDLFWQGGRQPVRPPVVQPRDTRFDQTIAITTHTGSRERLVQTFTAGAARPNVTAHSGRSGQPFR